MPSRSPTRTTAVVHCNYITKHGLIFNNSMRNHATIFNWKFPPCSTVNNAPRAYSLWVPCLVRKHQLPGELESDTFGEGKLEFFHLKCTKPKEGIFQLPVSTQLPVPWCSETHTSTLASGASSLLWKECLPSTASYLPQPSVPKVACAAPMSPCCIPASIPTLPLGTKSAETRFSLSLSSLRNTLSFLSMSQSCRGLQAGAQKVLVL